MKGLKLVAILCLSTSLAAAQKTIAVIGTGYVGLVLGTCLADFGHQVICADIDSSKIELLNSGHIPIYEPGLEPMVQHLSQAGVLKFSDNPADVVAQSDVIFIAVGTPMSDSGKADLRAVQAVARTIGENLTTHKVVCTKSTVPIGTGEEVRHIIEKFAPEGSTFDIVSNPEFLKEGSAINDFLYPERVVIGCDTPFARQTMEHIYAPLADQGVPFVWTDIPTAESIKYAANAFLATKISFINEMANLCDVTGADSKMLAHGIGLDSRIGKKFLHPGPGFGGSCFPKDVQALIHKGKTADIDLKVISAAIEANAAQKEWVFKKFLRLMNEDLEGKKIAVLGLAFKANTDDVRYSPAITFIERAREYGASIMAYDPVAMETIKEVFPDLECGESIDETLKDADAAVILTEWQQFKELDLERAKVLLKEPVVLDARNILSVQTLEDLGFTYENIGNAKV